MHRPASNIVAAERARWLADLARAIDEAQRLAWRISTEGSNPEAMDLYARLELARTEVDSLRRSGWASMRRNNLPDWTELLPDSLRLP